MISIKSSSLSIETDCPEEMESVLRFISEINEQCPDDIQVNKIKWSSLEELESFGDYTEHKDESESSPDEIEFDELDLDDILDEFEKENADDLSNYR